jgi:hypothetical protein
MPGRRAAAVSLGALLLSLGAAGYAFRERIEEEWRLHRLHSGTREERQAAVERLGRIGSARAIGPLLEAYAEECRRSSTFSGYQGVWQLPPGALRPSGLGSVSISGGKRRPSEEEAAYAEATASALLDLARRGNGTHLRELSVGLNHEVWDVHCFTVDVLGRIGPDARDFVPRLVDLVRGPRPDRGMLTRDSAMNTCLARALPAIGEPGSLFEPVLRRLAAMGRYDFQPAAEVGLSKIGVNP